MRRPAPPTYADAGAASVEATEDAAKKKRIKRESSFALGAFYGDVLATIGGNNPGPLNVLFDGRENGPLFAQALLLHAMVKTDMSPSQIKILEGEVKARLRVGPSLVDVDDDAEKQSKSDDFSPLLDSHARTLALVLSGLLAADPKSTLAPGLARKLLSLREAGAWRTTQEDSWALLALADYHQAQEPLPAELDAKVFLRGREILTSSFGASSSREDKVFVPALRVGRRERRPARLQRQRRQDALLLGRASLRDHRAAPASHSTRGSSSRSTSAGWPRPT